MRTSIVIAARNEGIALRHTVESCIESDFALDCEIIVADDASSDGSVEDVRDRFPQVRIYRHEKRLGVSPTRVLGACEARGEVLLFLDGHCKPEPGALRRLVEDVEESEGQATVTPAVAALDVHKWTNDLEQVGYGYRLELETLECGWLKPSDMLLTKLGHREFYESPSLIGAAFAVGRQLYAKLWGFDPHMKFWGVEDLDFGLKCWLMGHRILHDPLAVVGHRFRTSFDTNEIPLEYVLMNHLRLARKNFTQSVWTEWLDGYRVEHSGPLPDHPEGLWAMAWRLFELDQASVEQERRYLHGHRLADEFWYAERFGLPWPRIRGSAAAQRKAQTLPGEMRSPAPAFRLTPSAAPSAFPPRRFQTSFGPSPSPTKGRFEIYPATATLIRGQLLEFTVTGETVGTVHWTAEDGTPSAGSGTSFTTKWNSIGNKSVIATNARDATKARVQVVEVDGILTPREDFAARGDKQFKTGTEIDLSFVSSPSRTASELGGLRWSVASGGGRLAGAVEDDGTDRYTTPLSPGPVSLVLKFCRGLHAGQIASTNDIYVTEE